MAALFRGTRAYTGGGRGGEPYSSAYPQAASSIRPSHIHAQLSSQATQIKPLRGFDRLAAAGFTEEDIASIRQQFHAQSAGDYLDRDFESDEDCTLGCQSYLGTD